MNLGENLAPIILFVYERPAHTRRTLASLAANRLAAQSDLIVYADGVLDETDGHRVEEVRTIAHGTTGFRSVTVIERETNYGLARNIIEGVSEVCKRYGRVIVLEDDIVTSPYFLNFMNAALKRYADESRVWHISGWNYPIVPEDLGGAFFWRVMNCWGWATWADRWEQFRKEPQRLIDSWSRKEIARFNLDGTHDFWRQVIDNQEHNTNTWAIFWYATIFERKGLCLNPSVSYVWNIGNDGSGENCGGDDPFSIKQLANSVSDLPIHYEESSVAVRRIEEFYRKTQKSLTQTIFQRFRSRFLGDC